MRKKKAFTLIELLVVISVIALLVGILLPSLGSARKAANKSKNSTNLAGMVKRLTVIATEDETAVWPGAAADTAAAKVEDMVADPYSISPKSFVNPEDPSLLPTEWDGVGQPAICTSVDGSTKVGEFSYAFTQAVASWKNTLQSSVVLVSDRSQGNTTSGASVWGTTWEGSVGWGDAHAGFEKSNTVTALVGTVIKARNLFGATDEIDNTHD